MSDDRQVLVIGSGPSGAMAALTLVKQGIPVTMLESGQSLPSGWLVRVAGRNLIRSRPQVEDPKIHVASDDAGASWFHAHCLGGMSSHWAGAVPRFAPDDFFEGERLDERYRWPISYRDLEPYYEQIERMLSVTAARRSVPAQPASIVAHERRLPHDWDAVAEAAESLGHGLTPLPLAAGPRWALQRTGVGFNSYTNIVQPLERSPLFRLIRGAHALRLHWRGDEQKVTGITYFDRETGSEQQIKGAAVVVAAGPLASTSLLLNSTSPDFPEGLGETEGLLGHYLHDHPYDVGLVDLARPIDGLRQSAVLTRAPYAESSPLVGAACVLGSNSAWEKARTVTPFGSKSLGVWIFGTMVPTHGNYVRLDPSTKDAFGLPSLDVHIRYDESVPANMARARQRLADVFDAAGYPSTVRSVTPTLVPGQSIHYGGTVRMHSSRTYGMLNAWNRLHAVDNVVVADASCFTTGPEKNPTLTVMAIAARAAHRLAVDLKTANVRTSTRQLVAAGR
ncbi:MAG: GMC oxidoreductase [Chloroflexota bacterium]